MRAKVSDKVVKVKYGEEVLLLAIKVHFDQPLPDHGVYTVFIDLGNTKLELRKSEFWYIIYRPRFLNQSPSPCFYMILYLK